MSNEGKSIIPILDMPRDSCTPFLQFDRKFSVQIEERDIIQSKIDEFDNHIIQCYTDGSHIERKTGAGIYFKHQLPEMENQSIFLGIRGGSRGGAMGAVAPNHLFPAPIAPNSTFFSTQPSGSITYKYNMSFCTHKFLIFYFKT